MNALNTMSVSELKELIQNATQELNSRVQEKPKPCTLFSMWDADRYNGGWAKLVTGLDKTKTNGYSIIGSFIQGDEPRYWKEGEIVIDCNIGGSRKHQQKSYTVLKYIAGELVSIGTAGDSKSWAIKLWDALEEAGVPSVDSITTPQDNVNNDTSNDDIYYDHCDNSDMEDMGRYDV